MTVDSLQLRSECAADERAMRDMFVAIRRGPLDAAGFDALTVERLVQHQYELQRAGYRFAYPTAASEAIVVHGDVVGRLITDDDAHHLVLVDIMVAPAHQRRGIGSRVLVDVIARAGARPVELRVDHGSRAEPWYRRHGFAQVGADDLQAHLIRVPARSALTPVGV